MVLIQSRSSGEGSAISVSFSFGKWRRGCKFSKNWRENTKPRCQMQAKPLRHSVALAGRALRGLAASLVLPSRPTNERGEQVEQEKGTAKAGLLRAARHKRAPKARAWAPAVTWRRTNAPPNQFCRQEQSIATATHAGSAGPVSALPFQHSLTAASGRRAPGLLPRRQVFPPMKMDSHAMAFSLGVLLSW